MRLNLSNIMLCLFLFLLCIQFTHSLDECGTKYNASYYNIQVWSLVGFSYVPSTQCIQQNLMRFCDKFSAKYAQKPEYSIVRLNTDLGCLCNSGTYEANVTVYYYGNSNTSQQCLDVQYRQYYCNMFSKLWNGNDYTLSCQQCYQNYRLNDFGKCTPFVVYCSQYSNDLQSCVLCIKGYTLDNFKKCVPRNQTEVIIDPIELVSQRCDSFETQKYCVTCKQPFTNYQGLCLDPIKEKQYIDKNKLCLMNQLRSQLYDKCLTKIDYCLSYDETGMCLSCVQNYQLNPDVDLHSKDACRWRLEEQDASDCTPLLTQDQKLKYVYKKTKMAGCFTVDKQCSKFYPWGQCYQCIEGYFLYDRECYFIDTSLWQQNSVNENIDV